MNIIQRCHDVKLFLSVAFCMAAFGQVSIEGLKIVRTVILSCSIIILIISVILTRKNFRQSFVPHSIIAISLITIGNCLIKQIIVIQCISLFGTFLTWIGLCYSIVAVGIYLMEWSK